VLTSIEGAVALVTGGQRGPGGSDAEKPWAKEDRALPY
jgi:hypothetical protein